jgi:acyl-CoA reductase-like NAD-dependent aldehyde dehydrogenase
MPIEPARAYRQESMRIDGERAAGDGRRLEVLNPYTRASVGSVPLARVHDVRRAITVARACRPRLSRYERAEILQRAADMVLSRRDEISALITAESGLCRKDSLYEAGRVRDVLVFGAAAALDDDGQVFSCDITPHGRQRRVYTQRDPLLGVIVAITPFNHPMNQVAHKVVPAIATNNRMVLNRRRTCRSRPCCLPTSSTRPACHPGCCRSSPVTRPRSAMNC